MITCRRAHSETVDGPNGSQDPATGFVRGDPGGEIARSLCGTTVVARAGDAQTATWSYLLDANAGCRPPGMYPLSTPRRVRRGLRARLGSTRAIDNGYLRHSLSGGIDSPS